ncbi:dynamin family protein [Streptosporangium sp. NPDC051022]|uniref:dynamin family protein n=1 Tax=Streptosporangium sp. NPDC051022 TaxID=3155752 RepID=UPI0034342157
MTDFHAGQGGSASSPAVDHRAAIGRYLKLADRAMTALGQEEVPDAAAVRQAYDRAAGLAAKLRERCARPVSVGIVGEYSAGKSMLLGTLLGRPGLLPTSGSPTTGNVTVLRLQPAAPGEDTRVRGARIEYLTRDELADTVDYIMNELVRTVQRAGGGRDVSALAGYNPVRDGWEILNRWAETTLDWAAMENSRLLGITLELTRIRDALRLAGEFVLNGHSGLVLPVEVDILRQALDIEDIRELPRSFPRTAQGFPVSPRDPVTARTLRVGFTLIRRVVCQVSVAEGDWAGPLPGDGSAAELCDLPGLGATAVRDEYLSVRELDEIDAIVIVLPSHRAERDDARQFYSLLERNRRGKGALSESILVAANCFDLLQPPDTLHTGAADLIASSRDLASLHRMATTLNGRREDRIAFTSSLVAIATRGLPYDRGGEEGDKITKMLGAAGAQAERWKRIAGDLSLTDPDHAYTAALREFGRDGGISGLRAMLDRHVRTYGVFLKHEAVVPIAADLLAALRTLDRMLRPAVQGVSGDARGTGSLTALFRMIEEETSRTMRSLGLLTDPERLSVEGTWVAPGVGSAVLDLARAGATYDVFTWREWQEYRERVKDDGRIGPPLGRSQTGGTGRGSGFGIARAMPAEADATAPDTTERLFGRFEPTCVRAVGTAREIYLTAVASWAERRHRELAPARERLRDPAARAAAERLLTALDPGDGGEARWHNLLSLAAMDWLPGAAAGLLPVPVPLPAAETARIAERFPLRTAHALPWHGDRLNIAGDAGARIVSHQMNIFRVRGDIVAAVNHYLRRHLLADAARLGRVLREELQELRNAVPAEESVRSMTRSGPAEARRSGPSGGPIRDLLDEWGDEPGRKTR